MTTELLERNDVAEAERLIQESRQERIRKCGEAINAALESHGCLMVPVVVLRGNQVQSEIQIVAR